MIKAVCLMKRRPGMSAAAFREYYENHHARIGEAVFPGRAIRYVRRYLKPLEHSRDFGHANHEAANLSQQYDVIMEVWFKNEQTMDEAFEILAGAKLRRFIEQDEANLFAPGGIQIYFVDEYESPLAGRPELNAGEVEAALGIS